MLEDFMIVSVYLGYFGIFFLIACALDFLIQNNKTAKKLVKKFIDWMKIN